MLPITPLEVTRSSPPYLPPTSTRPGWPPGTWEFVACHALPPELRGHLGCHLVRCEAAMASSGVARRVLSTEVSRGIRGRPPPPERCCW